IQLPNIKSNLYKQLLTNLRLLYRKNNEDIMTREIIDFATVLNSKGMYKASLDMLHKAKQSAIYQEDYSLAFISLENERIIENQYVTGSIVYKAEVLEKESNVYLEKTILNNSLANLSIKTYAMYLKFGYVRSKRDSIFLENFFQSHMPEIKDKELGFYDKVYLYQSYTWYYYMLQDFANNYKFAQKWVDLFESNPEWKNQNNVLYIKGLHNVLSASYMANRIDKFEPNFKKLADFGKQNELLFNLNEKSIYDIAQGVHLLNYIFLTGKYSDGVKMIRYLEDLLKREKHDWDANRKLNFYYKLACVHFGAGDHSRCIDYLNTIINQPLTDLRNDIQCFARILNLIAHYELGNKLLISYQIKSVFRFLIKMEELQMVQKEVFSFLRKIPNMINEQLKNEFISLRNKLTKYQDDPFERRAFLYLDIIAWLDSKILEKPIELVIQENIQDLHKNSKNRDSVKQNLI
ncbi:MAG TPA: hypothetical protein PKD85_16015, partial [Saprospiraceae bacterium]|nr:hypothetical protein [Saprospiraceae bacterium]